MKRIYFSLSFVFLVLLSCSPGEQNKEHEQVKVYEIDDFYQNQEFYGGSFSRDNGKLLVSSSVTGIFNLYSIDTESGEVDTLTRSEDQSYFGISYFPEDERILYSADSGGNEINHIYLLDTDGTITDLTPGSKVKSSFVSWRRDLDGFYYISNARDPRFFDLYRMGLDNFESEMVYENTEGLQVGAISPDEKYLALIENITTSTNEMYLYNLANGERTRLSSGNADASYSPQEFDVKGEKLFYLSDEDAEFKYLASYDISDKESEKVYAADWDIWYAYHSFNEKYRVIGINQDARTVIRIMDMNSKQWVEVPSMGRSNVTSAVISRDESMMRYYAGSSAEPSDLFVYDFIDKEVKQLTSALNPEIDADDLVEGEVIRFASFDGTEIPSILYKPKVNSASDTYPVMVWVHGGPGGQTRLNYSPLVQYMVNHGYGIIGVNNRGSSGYGKTFYTMDDQRHGEDDLQDCIMAKDYLATLDWVDTSRIGIIGGSYGGYMVMAALAFAPEEFDVGVDIFGVTNWLRTLKSVPPWWESYRSALYKEMGDPFSADSVRLRKISPLFHAENVTKPLMVLQGANDPRVLQVESDEIVEAVKANGVPVEYLVFPDEGHGFVKEDNEIKAYGQVVEFLDTYLKDDSVSRESM